ncbi:MAG: hypothetical protein AB7V01_21710 [Vicinamibacterales bacterium]
MAVVEAVVVLGYAGWLALSVARQIGGLTSRRWRPLGALRLVPRWHLFARPTGHDVTLLQRTVDGAGRGTAWQAVPVAGPRRGWAWLWHPDLVERMIVLRVADFAETSRAPGGDTTPRPGELAYRALCSRLAASTPLAPGHHIEVALQLSRAHESGLPPVTVPVSPPQPFGAAPGGAPVRAR